ncbi:MAG TPA: GWxTD domain-containing protein [Thermoanaerobaculia bacterium]|nr:GWxTD domain-containing protein [Thermoanaerobaculia bacterium]
MTSKTAARDIAGAAILGVFLAGSAFASVSARYGQWAKGPVQWIMTGEEQRAYRSLKSDDQAIHFIDLFWARRDPTPGTAVNEFRNEFESRVAWSDKTWSEESGKIGSLTDRGRVYILLGQPTNMNDEMSKSTRQTHSSAQAQLDPTGGQVQGARGVWIWEHADSAKFGMPRIEVVFIEAVGSHSVHRDPQRPDFLGAVPVAMKRAIVSPGLTEVPSWAPKGGLDPMILVTVEQVARKPVMDVPQVAAPPAATVKETSPKTPKAEAPRPMAAKGASRLTLIRNATAVLMQAGNPFDRIEPVSVFHQQDELGWLAQYCSATVETPVVEFKLHLTGRAGNEVIDRRSEADELRPDRMHAVPGCFILRASIPLAGMKAGTYQLEVNLKDTVTGRSDTVKKEFRIE